MYRFFRIIFSLFLIVLLLYWVLSLRPYRVSGDSMMPNLNPESIVVIDKISPRIIWLKRGEIIVYRNIEDWIRIKRIIWLSEENLQIDNGSVWLLTNNILIPLEEKYLSKNVKTCVPGSCTEPGKYDYSIPKDHYFVLWDNRENSRDSRWCSDIADCKNKIPIYISRDDIVWKVIFSW